MGSKEKQVSDDYLILKPESVSLLDLFLFLLPFGFIDIRTLADIPDGKEDSYTSFRDRWVIFISILLQKLVIAVSNLFKLSHSVRGICTRTGNVVGGILARKSKATEVKCRDWRIEVGKKNKIKLGEENDFTNNGALTMMASALAYQDYSPVPSVVQTVVNNCWKMNLLECYNDFWNDFQDEVATQAFTFQNTATDPNVTIVAFRGTSSFDDVKEDINCSWYNIEGIGHIHYGFMQALGLQKDSGWPKELPPRPDHHQFAYYTLRQQLRDIVKANENASFIFTGHSLGGALAALFVTILAFHDESALLQKLQAVYTFGQPRVGDTNFAEFMDNTIKTYGFKYYRYVYSFDIVPRVPLNINSWYKHFGGCVYYNSCYKGEILETEPDKNYILEFWLIPYMYLIAWYELIRSLVIPIIKWNSDYFEGFYTLMVRLFGLIIPGISAHICPNYINSTRYGKIQPSKDIETLLPKRMKKVSY